MEGLWVEIFHTKIWLYIAETVRDSYYRILIGTCV